MQLFDSYVGVVRDKYGAMSIRCDKNLNVSGDELFKCSKTYIKCQDYRIKWVFTYFYIDILVSTGDIDQFLRNRD